MSSEEEDAFAQPTLWVLIGTLVSAFIGGVSWCVQKKCRRTHCALNSGCCEFSADSEVLRRTIREEIKQERQERESSSGALTPERVEEERKQPVEV
jgi:hypothetical protein|tara:strand:+ start:753 stop:1040 length:288 start_codon:yes stop_codon:yes gene_type:complete